MAVETLKYELDDITSNHSGFNRLATLAEVLSHNEFKRIEINMQKVHWLEANMCSPLGAILYKVSRRPNVVVLNNISKSVQEILTKNSFLSTYGYENIPDVHHTTIEYKRFDVGDQRYFNHYVLEELIRNELPEMSPALLKNFQKSIFEIFSNSVVHSQTKFGIFTCGQFFPNKNRLNFTITDLGIGIKACIKQFNQLDITAVEAIKWAVEKGHSTKIGDVPGGLGLKLLCEFIAMNGGIIQIVSDLGFWEFSKNKVTAKNLNTTFPGTCVNIEINTQDNNKYCMNEELTTEDLF